MHNVQCRYIVRIRVRRFELFFLKMKDPDTEMGVKLDSKTHLENTFFDFLSRFGRICLKSLQKVLIIPPKIFFEKNSYRIPKNVQFHADFKSFKFNAKKCIQEKLYAKQFDAHL